MKLAEQLTALRKAKGWTQAEAARNISIQQPYLSKLENGHFVPSDEVIQKLSKAYGVKAKTLQPRPQKRFTHFTPALLLPLIGILLIISGTNAMLFSSTYYTYKTEPVSPIDQTELYLDYHLSDTYLGERFISEESGTKYHFVLIASRDVERSENKLQTIIGIALILASLGFHFRRWQSVIQRIRQKTTSDDQRR